MSSPLPVAVRGRRHGKDGYHCFDQRTKDFLAQTTSVDRYPSKVFADQFDDPKLANLWIMGDLSLPGSICGPAVDDVVEVWASRVSVGSGSLWEQFLTGARGVGALGSRQGNNVYGVLGGEPISEYGWVDLSSPISTLAQPDAHHLEAVVTPESFLPSRDLVAVILQWQADGDPRSNTAGDDQRLWAEISERIVEGIGDLGYRWQDRKQSVGKVATFAAAGGLVWCEDELAKILLFELNVAVLGARDTLEAIFLELRDFLQSRFLSGDWGSIQVDGLNLILIPAEVE